jgi:hypothetical protein
VYSAGTLVNREVVLDAAKTSGCGGRCVVFYRPEVFVSHRHARLNFRGRLLLVPRVRGQVWAVAHAAKAQGVSRQCAHRWIARFDAEVKAYVELLLALS